ncbi:DUF3325 family protein [Sphingomonas sp. MMS12-HWE2-04]|uniref:DUF3325 family protein n=1 Tax=Sphingomonas sp. MMS12-HWE2-04 TaxID=3234199 RepID=UPI0038516A10
MSALAALLLAVAGFALLALAMRRHAREAEVKAEWLRLTPAQRRPAGYALLAVSLAALLMLAPRWDFALIEWIGLIAAAAGLVALGLWQAPRQMPRLALACGAGGLAATLAALALG